MADKSETTKQPRMWPIYLMCFCFMSYPIYLLWESHEHPKPVAPKDQLEACVLQCVRRTP